MAQTILQGDVETEIASATAQDSHLWVPLDALEGATGWAARPEGLCRAGACVPIPDGQGWLDPTGAKLDYAAFAAHLGHAIARDEAHSVWSFGPPAGRPYAAIGTGPVVAPDLRLPDLDGEMRSLSDYRGKKVLLYCWASW